MQLCIQIFVENILDEKDKVLVKVICQEEELYSMIVDSSSMFDIMIKSKKCIETCYKKLQKYKNSGA